MRVRDTVRITWRPALALMDRVTARVMSVLPAIPVRSRSRLEIGHTTRVVLVIPWAAPIMFGDRVIGLYITDKEYGSMVTMC